MTLPCVVLNCAALKAAVTASIQFCLVLAENKVTSSAPGGTGHGGGGGGHIDCTPSPQATGGRTARTIKNRPATPATRLAPTSTLPMMNVHSAATRPNSLLRPRTSGAINACATICPTRKTTVPSCLRP